MRGPVIFVGLALLGTVAAHDCFNCAAGGECLHFGSCNNFTGVCECPPGFGGVDCKQPVCGGLDEQPYRPVRRENSTCVCSDGWDGVNCNMCTSNQACEAFMPSPGAGDAQCYAGGLLVDTNFHMCNVTNRKVLDVLAGRDAEVTFGCARNSSSCDLQLWVDEVESFFCKFSECEFDGLDYHCGTIQCQCQPGELLCGAEGSIDISEWLEKSVKGPGDLRCDDSGRCSFEEPAMNQLIKFVFGDHSIELQCHASECLHYSQVPGYLPPTKRQASPLRLALDVAGSLGLVAAISWALRRAIREDAESSAPHKSARLASEEPVNSVTPVGLYFEKLRYTTDSGKEILGLVSGAVPPGHVLAIMGGSGAGKTTLLDILAAKHKMGTVEGVVRLNGSPVSSESPLRALIGFVDQSDSSLVPTQTVYEHVMFSALLRLPRSMSRATKELRVLDTLSELGIAHLSQQLVGKGLSGGERRRVAIACELVTSPSVLLLDEPTSGLDAFSAFSVVETLVNLAKSSRRTVVFTIHQPRSNIVSLFDRILLLAQGQLVFTGTPAAAETHFADLGHPCPPNYNFADFIVDLSMKAALVMPYTDDSTASVDAASLHTEHSDAGAGRGIGAPNGHGSTDVHATNAAPGTFDHGGGVGIGVGVGTGIGNDSEQAADDVLSDEDGTTTHANIYPSTNYIDPDADCLDPTLHTDPLQADPAREWEDFAYHRQQISRSAAQAMANSQLSLKDEGLEPFLAAFRTSPASLDLAEELLSSARLPADLSADVRRATLLDQFKIISLRTFRNLYRDPMLVLTHYGISIGLGILCGYLYFNVTNDIPGFQNRLGLFFFLLSVFGFSTLTSVSLFARERLVFVRERANGYYHPVTYYTAKVLLDIVPLRIGPPLLLGAILYPLVGLNVDDNAPLVFMLVLTLFNLSAATIMLLIGILVADFGVATLVGCMVNLFGILFAGLFLNQESMPTGSGWAKLLSIFHYAYEALSVNEVKYLTLTEDKFGLKIEVPGATILSAFGFDNEAVSRDIFGLAITAVVFLVVGYIALDRHLIERR